MKITQKMFFIATMLVSVPYALANSGEINLEEGPEIPQLSTEELAAWIKEGKPLVLVDARGPESYAQEHLPRAINVPADQVETLSATLPKQALIVVYCGGPKCPHSTVVARWLVDRGWKRVRHYAEGISGWSQAGYPLERAGQPAGVSR